MMTPTAVQIRWMIRRDMPEVLAIESECFPVPWSEEDFLVALRQRNCIGMIAEHNEKIVGFMVYELLKSALHVLNFAVAPWACRKGIGSQMVEKLIHKVSQQRRTEILIDVEEWNIAGQLFFKSKGFKAIGVVHDHLDSGEDAYQMRWMVQSSEKKPYQPKNRISEFFKD
jgi:ribosomal-protein-alanine N-acetyltransferase